VSVHRACPIKSPFAWTIWPAWALSMIPLWGLLALHLFPWNMAAWFGTWVLALTPEAWWEWRHRPSKMYVSWWPE
jgi:hypothetical protein